MKFLADLLVILLMVSSCTISHQGSMSVKDYTLKFRMLVPVGGMSSRSSLHIGRDTRERLHLAAYDHTIDLECFIQLSIRFDSHMQSCLEEHLGQPYTPFLGWSAFISTPEPGHESMQVKNTRLSFAEQQRQLLPDLCLYCGASGHNAHTTSSRYARGTNGRPLL